MLVDLVLVVDRPSLVQVGPSVGEIGHHLGVPHLQERLVPEALQKMLV